MCTKYELVGQKFNRLTVVEKTEGRRNEQILWKCVCDCGNTRLVTLANWARKADVPYDKVYHRLAKGENPDDVIGPLVKGRASTYVHV